MPAALQRFWLLGWGPAALCLLLQHMHMQMSQVCMTTLGALQQNMHIVQSAFQHSFAILIVSMYMTHQGEPCNKMECEFDITTRADPHAGCLITLDHNMDRTSYRSAKYVLHAQNKLGARFGSLLLLHVTLVPGQGRMRLWLTALTASFLCSNYSRGRGHKADLLTPQLG